jgi:hypothetical protein
MCDYSLHGISNRLATEGEQLVVHQFCTGSKGLASPSDLRSPVTAPPSPPGSLWSRLKHWFNSPPNTLKGRATPAVCIPPGARLILQDIPARLQEQFGVGPAEEVTFVQLSADPYRYRDAIRFSNGLSVLLQKLQPGQRVEVRCLESVEETLPQGVNSSLAINRT